MNKTTDFPLVSVIIPAYNHDQFIEKTIRSVMAQTYPNIELIIINDGSKDKTWNIINKLHKECVEKLQRVIIKDQENQGTCRTLNRLITLAKGEYIALIASDDMYAPRAIETLTSFLMNHSEYVLAVANNQYIDSSDKFLGYKIVKNSTQYITTTFKDYLQINSGIDFTSDKFGHYYSFLDGNHIPNGYVIRASALKKILFTPEAPLEDYYMHFQLSKMGKYQYIDEILFFYRQHDESTSNKQEHMIKMTMQTFKYEINKTLAQNDRFSDMIQLYHVKNKKKYEHSNV